MNSIALMDAPRVTHNRAAAGQQVVDPVSGVFERLLAITANSKKGTVYSDSMLDRIVVLAPGRPININHVSPGERRPLQDRIGQIDRAWREGHRVWISGSFNPYHPLFNQIVHDANNHPKNLGFSIDSRGNSTSVGGKKIVTSIDVLLSVDLVANPAATSGLLESRDGQQEDFSPLPPAIRRQLRQGQSGDFCDIFTAARIEQTRRRFMQAAAADEPEPLVEDSLAALGIDNPPPFIPPKSAPLTTRLRRFQ